MNQRPDLIECPFKAIDRYGLLDRCLGIRSGIYTYTCTSKNQTEARGLKDNQCTTIRGVEWCVCDTDGCNSANLSPLQIFPSSANPTLIPTQTPNPSPIQITPMVAIALLLMFVILLLLVLMLVFQKLLCKGKE